MSKLSVAQTLSRAKAFEKRGEVIAAAGLYRDVLAQFPNNMRAAKALSALGDQLPKSSVSQNELNRLKVLYDRQDHAGLVNATRALLRKYPSSFTMWNILGAAHKELDQADEAIGAFSAACRINPRNLDSQMNLADQLWTQDHFEDAFKHYQIVLEIQPDHTEALFKTAEFHLRDENLEVAIADYQRVIAADPEHEAAQLSLSRALLKCGRVEEAKLALTDLWNNGSRSLGLFFRLTTTFRNIPFDDCAEEFEKMLEDRPELRDLEPESIRFLRARLLSDARHYEEASCELESANALALTRLSETLRSELEMFSRTMDILSKIAPLSHTNDNKTPKALLILGPSRSGKTTLESLVVQMAGASAGFENDAFRHALTETQREFGVDENKWADQLPDEYNARFVENVYRTIDELAEPGTMLTMTNPGLALNAAVLVAKIPNLRIVFVKRDPDDVALRIFQTQYESGNAYSYNLKTIKRHIEWYNEMMHATKSKFPDIVRVVKYEDMVEDPKRILDEVADFCNLPRLEGAVVSVPDDRGCSAPYKDYLTF